MNEQTSLLSVSLLQVLRMVHFLRKCTMRKTCKKSFRSPKATMLRDRRARLNESIAPTDPQAQDLGACLVLIMGTHDREEDQTIPSSDYVVSADKTEQA